VVPDDLQQRWQRASGHSQAAFTTLRRKREWILLPIARFFGKLCRNFRARHLFPASMGYFAQCRARLHFESERLRKDLRRFHGAAERGCVNRHNSLGPQPQCEPATLFPTFVRKRHIDASGKSIFRGQHRRPVTNQKNPSDRRNHRKEFTTGNARSQSGGAGSTSTRVARFCILLRMNEQEQEAIFTICLMAAFADGGKSELERTELKRIAEGFPGIANAPAIYQRVLTRQVTPQQAATAIASQDLRQLAYEMAVCVCEADDLINEAERTFLTTLRQELRLDPATVAAFERQAEGIATEPVAAAVPPPIPKAPPPAMDAETDRMILNYAILNGALELLPESLATMAIVPLQMKMVYRIGKASGHDIDRGHIKELLAAAGLGLTSQVVEGYARKLIGGLAGKLLGGGIVRGLTNQLTSSGMSFATTYALGHLAWRYYSGGRKLSTAQLKDTFSSLLGEAKSLHPRHLNDIQQKARQVNVSQLLPLIRG
jgi:uncharacterized protein (DUF697 family)